MSVLIVDHDDDDVIDWDINLFCYDGGLISWCVPTIRERFGNQSIDGLIDGEIWLLTGDRKTWLRTPYSKENRHQIAEAMIKIINWFTNGNDGWIRMMMMVKGIEDQSMTSQVLSPSLARAWGHSHFEIHTQMNH